MRARSELEGECEDGVQDNRTLALPRMIAMGRCEARNERIRQQSSTGECPRTADDRQNAQDDREVVPRDSERPEDWQIASQHSTARISQR
jgi:hypothetical protein